MEQVMRPPGHFHAGAGRHSLPARRPESRGAGRKPDRSPDHQI